MKLWMRFSLIIAVPFYLASCAEPASVGLIAKSQAAYAQYTGKNPGTLLVTGFLTTPPLASTYPEAVRDLQLELATEIATQKTYTQTTEVLDLIESLTNALKMVTMISVVLDNAAPELPSNLSSPVASVYFQNVRDTERSKYELVGEQVVVGLQMPTTATSHTPSQLSAVHDKMLYEGNKARANGELLRADLIRIDAVTLGNYAQQQGTSSGTQVVPNPTPSAAVPDALTEVGIMASGAHTLRLLRKDIDADNRFLPEDCDNIVIDEDTCSIQPLAIRPPSNAVAPLTLTDYPSGFPVDLGPATNIVIGEVNAALENFIATPAGGPISPTLASKIATLEVETAQLLAYFNLIKDSTYSRAYANAVKKAQTLVVVLATLLNVAAPVNASSYSTPDLNGLNLLEIPSTPVSPLSTGPFLDTRARAITLEDALTEGSLRAEKALYQIVGENILSLHRFDSDTVPAPAPTSEQIALIKKNYEEVAIKADNNGEPERAALLRVLKTGFSLTTSSPAVLPAPDATTEIKNTLTQAGYPAALAQRADSRRAAIDVNNANVPTECDDRTWDSATCPLTP